MKSKIKCVALYGFQGAGKSPIAHSVNTNDCRVLVRSFATPIKAMVDPFADKYMRTEGKNDVCPVYGFSRRQLYQAVGQAGRSLNSITWGLILKEETHINIDGIIIDDLRFNNERQFLTEHFDTTFVRIKQDDELEQHSGDDVSEVDWKKWAGDDWLSNSPSLRQSNLMFLRSMYHNRG